MNFVHRFSIAAYLPQRNNLVPSTRHASRGIKKFSVLFAVLLAFIPISRADESYVGVYYATHAPKPYRRESGAMALLLKDDGSAQMTSYYSSNVVRVATGT